MEVEGWNDMLTDPPTDDQDKKVNRATVSCEHRWQKYRLKEKNFTLQYSHIYTVRQLKMRARVQ